MTRWPYNEPVSLWSLWSQDIRRFFAPTAGKPAAKKTSHNGNLGKETKPKSVSSDDDTKNKNKNKKVSKARLHFHLDHNACVCQIPSLC